MNQAPKIRVKVPDCQWPLGSLPPRQQAETLLEPQRSAAQQRSGSALGITHSNDIDVCLKNELTSIYIHLYPPNGYSWGNDDV